ncbi:MAG: ATP-dependent helicase [Puniceicoccales bacterium]|jgi:DNA helicase-2/ATP-dependent DNA helicase PcrA|nr:ATP-dependent helicase [Puniceicoccales bacterium]
MPNFMKQILPINFEMALNEDQLRAVTADDGPAIVLAGAGSGKTRTLTYRVAWLLSNGVSPHRILLLTFTNKAAKEMLTRVEDLTNVPRSEFWGGTFHSIGLRILRSNASILGLDKNFTIMDAGDSDSLFAETAKSVNGSFFKERDAIKPRVIYDAYSFARNTRRPLEEVLSARFSWLKDDTIELLLPFFSAYQNAKREKNLCDYDDLLELWVELLEKHSDIRAFYQNRFSHILVDEFQDTNKLQSDIVDALAGNHQLMVVGDDAQCIYTWRGAEFANVADFRKRHPNATIHKIEINYRSTPEILNLANGIFASQGDIHGFSKTLRPSRPAGEKPYFVSVMDTKEQAGFIVRCVTNLAENGRSLGDMIVLYRAHYQAMELQIELTRCGIPFVITSGVRFFEQAHIRDLVAHLRFAHNPTDSVAFSRLMALLPKIGPKTTLRILESATALAHSTKQTFTSALTNKKIIEKVPAPARDSYRDLALVLDDMAEALRVRSSSETPESDNPQPTVVKTIAEIMRIAIEGWYSDFLPNLYPDWRERRDDFDFLLAFASKFTDVNELLAQLVLLNSDADNKSPDPEANPSLLRLSTIHQAKGLEFPVVFVIGCADELFPLKRAIEADDLDEERRLFYVAVTRAMELLYLICPRITRTGGPPRLLEISRFIQALPDEAYSAIRTINGAYNR